MYGSVVAVGRETKGETVKGTCSRSGWEPRLVSNLSSSVETVCVLTVLVHGDCICKYSARKGVRW